MPSLSSSFLHNYVAPFSKPLSPLCSSFTSTLIFPVSPIISSFGPSAILQAFVFSPHHIIFAVLPSATSPCFCLFTSNWHLFASIFSRFLFFPPPSQPVVRRTTSHMVIYNSTVVCFQNKQNWLTSISICAKRGYLSLYLGLSLFSPENSGFKKTT